MFSTYNQCCRAEHFLVVFGFKNQDVFQAPEQNSRSGFKNQNVFQAPEQNWRSGFATQPARFLMTDCCPKYSQL